MRKLFYIMFFAASISFAASNVTIAQDTKAKTTCCKKAVTANADAKTANCPMADKTKAKADCPMAGKKDCPMAGKKECPKANCPMKNGATAKKSAVKSGPVAEVK